MRIEDTSWEVRARAAEKTAAVLKQRLHAIDSGEERSVIKAQLESMQRRAIEIERRRALGELRTQELQRYSATLESEVAARTRQVRTILDHVTAGLLLLGRDLHVEPGASAHCATLLGGSDVVGARFADCLRLTGERAATLEVGLEQIFDDVLPEAVSVEQVLRRVTLDARVLDLAYRAVRDDAGAVTSVLVTITDISAQIAAERAARRAQSLVAILRQIKAFRAFVVDVRQTLSEALDAVEEGDDTFTRRAIHTVKGNASLFGLDDVVQVCHEVEDLARLDPPAIERVARALLKFLDEHYELLQIPTGEATTDPDERYAVSRAHLERLARQAAAGEARAVERLLAELRVVPVGEALMPLDAAVVRVAERLEKEIDLVLEGTDTLIDPARLAPILRCIPHLLRNAVDHGIERPDARGEKPERGRLRVAFRDDAGDFVLEVSDDGRGIDPSKVAEVAAARGLVAPGSALTDEAVFDLLSQDGFSTADDVTEISGRGVGLSAMRSAVEALGGTMSLSSSPGRGTTFLVRVPKS